MKESSVCFVLTAKSLIRHGWRRHDVIRTSIIHEHCFTNRNIFQQALIDRLALIRCRPWICSRNGDRKNSRSLYSQKMFERAEQSVALVIESKFQTGLTKSAFSVANRRLEKLRSFSKLTILVLIGGHDVLAFWPFCRCQCQKEAFHLFPWQRNPFLFFTSHAIAVVKPGNGQKHATRETRFSVCTKWRTFTCYEKLTSIGGTSFCNWRHC